MKRQGIALALAAVTVFGCYGSAAQELPGLISLWKGESNVADSKGTNNGSVFVPPQGITYVAGHDGQAFSFEGGIINIPHAAALAPSNVSVQAWVKGTGLPAFRYIISKAKGAGGVSYALYTGDDSGIHFFANAAGTAMSGGPAAATVWDGNWHHIVGTYDGTNSTLYLDGVAQAGGLPSTGPIDYTDPQPLLFGDYQVARGLPYPGQLDEAKVWNRALSAEDVSAIFANPNAAAGAAGLVAHWKGEGNAQDSVGTNHGADGVPAPRPFEFAPGKEGMGFFPKGGIATVPDSLSLQPENLSLQLWVRCVAPPPFRYLVCKSRAVGGITWALYTGDGRDLRFFLNGGVIMTSRVDSEVIWDGAWHMVTATYDGATARIYIDGLEAGTGVGGAPIDYSEPKELIFGDYQVAGGFPYVGQMDEIQLYNRALTPAEILQSFTQNKLVSWWSASTNSLDSIDSNHGTLVGTATYALGRSTGRSFDFGSAGLVEVADSANLRPNNITVEAMVSGTAPGASKYILSKSHTATDASYAFFTGPSGGLEFYVTLPTGRVSSPNAGTAIWDGYYHAIAGVYDGSKVRLFVDGKEVGTGTSATGNIVYSTAQNSGKLLFGDFAATPGTAGFDNVLDEVKIYNTGLTAKQVADDTITPIMIIAQPASTTITPGTPVTLTVQALGPTPLRYQWTSNGTNLPGATSASLVLSNAQPGNYAVQVRGPTVTYTNGKSGSALASGTVRIPNHPSFETNNFTIQVWAKGTNVGVYKYLWSKSRDPVFYSSSYGIYTSGDGGLWMFVLLDGPTLSAANFITASTVASNIWDNNWHLVTGTWDDNRLALYIDGTLIQENDLTSTGGGGPLAYGSSFLYGDVLIGDVLGTPSEYHFPGTIDDVKYFNRALTAQEVADSFANPTGPAGTGGLLGWWKLDGNTLDTQGLHDGYPVPPPSLAISDVATLTASATAPSIGNARASGSNFQADIAGVAGASYVVLRSADLKTWTPFSTNTAPFTVTDPIATGAKFYRAMAQ